MQRTRVWLVGLHMTRTKGTSDESGMGVVELMVGLGLMAVAIMGLNSLAISAVRNNLSARLIDEATQLAEQKMEQIKHDGFAAAVPGTKVEQYLDYTGKSGGGFQRTTVISAGTLANTRTITVTMMWTDYGMRQTSFYTEIAQ